MSSSKEISGAGNLTPVRKSGYKKSSLSFELQKDEESITLISPDRRSFQPVLSCKKSYSTIEQSLEIDRNNEISSEDLAEIPPENDDFSNKNTSAREMVPSKTRIYYMNFDEAITKFNSLPSIYTDVYL